MKQLTIRRFLMAIGREFQIDDLENARLILYRSLQGNGRIKLFGSYVPGKELANTLDT